jgi:hypothetical protein
LISTFKMEGQLTQEKPPDEAANPPVRAGKVRLVSMDQIDRRTKAAQLALEAKQSIIADLGGLDQLSTLERLACEHAAMASAVTADAYARWLKGEEIALTEIATVQNAFLRVASSLGFARRAKDVTKSINEYLADADSNMAATSAADPSETKDLDDDSK